jgi:glutamyl-tRNA reductase
MKFSGTGNGDLHVGALGTDFKTASLRMRDALYLDKKRVLAFLDSISAESPLLETVALSTCNRIEIYYACRDHAQASTWLRDHLVKFHGVPRPHLDRAFKEYQCAEAVRHLLHVVSGTESMIFGEHEILGQVRDAYHLCRDHKTTGPYHNRLFQHAIATGKLVRSMTAAGRGALSVGSIAIERILELSHGINDKRTLIVGAGTMGIRALKRLRAEDAGAIALANRTDERAKKFCAYFNVQYLPFSELHSSLSNYDIAILATGSQEYLITPADIRRGPPPLRPLLIVDLGAPRNANPATGAIEGVTIICIDDLKDIADRRLSERKKDMDSIRAIIEEQVGKFTQWYDFKKHLAPNKC